MTQQSTSTQRKVRFIHSSDWQLGMTRAFLSTEASARFSQARLDAISKLGQLAKEHEAQFVVVAGDVFESNQLSKQTLMRALDALESIPVPIFLLPGNHDPLDGASIFSTEEFLKASSHIVVLRDMTPIPVPNLPGVEVVGAPWRTKHPTSDLCTDLALALEPTTGVRIAVAHGQVNTLSPDQAKPDIINVASSEQAIASGLFQYLALGDRHSVTDVGDSGRIWYSGAPVATDYDEVEPNKALLVELDPTSGCNVQRLSTGDWTFIAEHRQINSLEDVGAFEVWLAEQPNKPCTTIKVSLEGSINLATAAALDTVMDDQAELFASLYRRQRHSNLTIVPNELDQDSVTLSGYARSTWDDLLESAQTGDDQAQDALRLFYRLAGSQT